MSLPPKDDLSSTTSDSTKQSSTPSFLGSFLQTIKDIFSDKGVLLLLLIAPIIYGFFYPWPYSTEVVNHVPVGIIDNDNSNLSRTIVRYASASPQLDTQLFLNEQQAKRPYGQMKSLGTWSFQVGLSSKYYREKQRASAYWVMAATFC